MTKGKNTTTTSLATVSGQQQGIFYIHQYDFSAPSNNMDITYQGLCYTCCGALAGMRNSWIGQPSTRWVRHSTLWLDAPSLSYVQLPKNQGKPVVDHWLQWEIAELVHQVGPTFHQVQLITLWPDAPSLRLRSVAQKPRKAAGTTSQNALTGRFVFSIQHAVT